MTSSTLFVFSVISEANYSFSDAGWTGGMAPLSASNRFYRVYVRQGNLR